MSESNPIGAPNSSAATRRDFLRSAALATAGAYLTGCSTADRRGEFEPLIVSADLAAERPLRIGVIGAGGRGTGAAIDCVKASPNVTVVAIADLFPDRAAESKATLAKEVGDKATVADGRVFSGFDAYQRVCALQDVDLVVLAAPPGFRPLHLKAAIEAGKHVFTEKPVAVDPVGVRSVIATSELAAQKQLAIVAGTQRRHQPSYLEAMKRVRDGAIGEVVAAQCYWNQVDLWVKEKQPEWSDMEWQCRNWLYFQWLSGDHIVEQHVHNLDVVNWAIGATPVKALGMGGRAARTAPPFGDVWDHFSVEYEYPGGARALSFCRQTKGASERIGERIIGTQGVLDMSFTYARISGRRTWEFDDGGKPVNPYEQEQADLVASIRLGRPLNEGRQVAESTLTAIMGRMSAYSGRELSWEWVSKASQLDLTPAAYEFGPRPVGPAPVPGEWKLV